MPSPNRANLNPTLRERLRRICTPGWLRTVAVRRGAAAVLIVTACTVVIVDQNRPESPTALVAAHDLAPGDLLTADDVRAAPVPDHLMPANAPTIAEVTGRRVTGAVLAGEILGTHRLLESRLPALLTGDPDARLVPVRPADDTVISLVRVGDRVDLVTQESTVLARNAIIALVPPADTAHSQRNRSTPVLVATDVRAADRVAAAALSSAMTFVLH